MDTYLINRLQALRDHYTLEKMQLVRAEILQVDDSAAVLQAVQSLTTANGSLVAIQKGAAATTQWVNEASTALTTVASAVTNLEAARGG